MALIRCKDCGGSIAQSGKACPLCGSQTPTNSAAFSSAVSGLLGFAFWAGVVALVLWIGV